MISLLKNHEHLFLKNSIESLRNEMIRIGIQEGLTSRRTIEISQKLDVYITQYQELKRKIY